LAYSALHATWRAPQRFQLDIGGVRKSSFISDAR
jgi:hypothetical protein